MFKFLQILLVIPFVLASAHGQGFTSYRNPDKIGDVLEEDFAAKVVIQTKYDLASDFHLEFEAVTRYDYHVSIEHNQIHQCSGAVVQVGFMKAVVVPASCVEGKTDLIVRYATPTRESGGIETQVRKVVIHENYLYNGHINDIAVVYTSTVIDIQSPLLLPTIADIAVGTTATITGWPTMYEEDRKNLLLYSIFKIVPNAECYSMYQDAMLCAGERKKDTSYCHYNTGSPLVANGKLLGFSLWDKGCRRDIAPSVFLSVPAMADWLRNTITNNA